MFIYSEVSEKLQTELHNEGCQDYIRVLQECDPNPLPPPWTPQPCLLVRKYKQFAERIRDFKVLADDIWIVTYPKCGTTWAQEMIWLLANGLDYKTAKSVDVNQRSPYFEISGIGTNLHFDSLEHVERGVGACKGPRVIKCHLPINLLPAALFRVNPKIIYVTRNAKDTAISYFHHYRMLLGYKGSLDTFLDAFLGGDLIYGSHSRHIEEFVQFQGVKQRSKGESNLLILRYEDMKRSMGSILQQAAKFLHGGVLSEPEIEGLAQHLSFEQMRQNGACNNERMSRNAMDMNGRRGEERFHFLRRGQIGTYLKEMPQQFIERFDARAEQLSDELQFYISAQ